MNMKCSCGLLCTFHLDADWIDPSVAGLSDVVLPERDQVVDHLVVVVPHLRVPHEGSEEVTKS